jgi:mannose-6-phosphate isomerase
VSLCPSRLEPVFSSRPWGSGSLAPFFPERSDLASPIGEAWLTGSECSFANGPFEGRKLGEVWPQMPSEWTGTALRPPSGIFPLLVKFIFPSEKLSVQVHPDDAYASRHEQAAGGCGKTEMWYALRASPGASVLVGLRTDVTSVQFKEAIEAGNAEELLTKIPLAAGESIFVPAGTVHTIGPGLVLCEIQQHSDLTYRVYDYNRRDTNGKPRDLHVEKALEVIRFGQQPEVKIRPLRVERNGLTKTYFAVCRYFATEKWEFSARIAASTSPKHFDLLIFLEGGGNLCTKHDRFDYRPAHVWLLPAALGAYEIEPASSTSLLRTYVPSASIEFTRALREEGVAETGMVASGALMKLSERPSCEG